MKYSTINGCVFLKKSQSYTANSRTSLTGTFTSNDDLPFYVHKYEDPFGSIDSSMIVTASKTFTGVVHLNESPSLSIPLEQKAKFKFVEDYEFIKIGKLKLPMDNISYVETCVYGINYIIVPMTSVVAIQYEFSI